jgi:hypothetical protein
MSEDFSAEGATTERLLALLETIYAELKLRGEFGFDFDDDDIPGHRD